MRAQTIVTVYDRHLTIEKVSITHPRHPIPRLELESSVLFERKFRETWNLCLNTKLSLMTTCTST